MRRRLAAVLLAAVALGYAVTLHRWHGDARTVSAAVAGGAVLLVGELLFSAADRVRPSAVWLAACLLGGFVVAIVVLLVAAADLSRSLGLIVAGTVAAVAAVWLIVEALRERTSEDEGFRRG